MDPGMTEKMTEQVKTLLSGHSVLCALSGGLDSVVLLHLLLRCGLRVAAAHMEHGIRGENSLRDCRFVQELCREWNVQLAVEHVDIPALAAAQKAGLEETARRERYRFLEEQRQQLGLEKIVTAHHENDQAETVLMHMIRGCAPAGLGGMRAEDGALMRPLLGFTRKELEKYAEENRLPHVEDETNRDTEYTRNYIRHVLLPEMEKLNPKAVQAIARLSVLSVEQSDYLYGLAEEELRKRQHGDALDDLKALHPALCRIVLQKFLFSLGIDEVENSDISRLMTLMKMPTGHRVSLGKELFEHDTNGIRRVIMIEPGMYTLKMGENITPFGCFELSVEKCPDSLNLGRFVQVMEEAWLQRSLTVRTRRDGDRIRLADGRSRLLSDVLSDRKIPRTLRDRVPLLEADGEILWIAGVMPCLPCLLKEKRERVLLIQYKPDKE